MKLQTLLVLAALLGVSLVGRSERGREGTEWLTDLDTAFRLAADTERPLLIVFR